MDKRLTPNDVRVMYSALSLLANSADDESTTITFSDNLENPFAEEQDRVQKLLQKLDDFQNAPENGLFLHKQDKALVVNALRELIGFNNDMLKTENRAKRIKDYQNEIRAATVCVSRLG